MKANLIQLYVKSLPVNLAIAFGATALYAEQPIKNNEAIVHLKNSGHYNSLGEAIELARYSIHTAEENSQKAWAQNQQHALKATFDVEGLHLNVQDENQELYQSNWRLESAGGSKVAAGELRYHGQRAEIVRPNLTEWFVNRPTGLEHGFTLSHRPEGAGSQLQLVVTIEGDLKIAISEDGQRAELQDKKSGAKVLDYDKLRVWDVTGTEFPARMAALSNGTQFQLNVNDADARYPLTIDPTFTQEAFLKASNAEENDGFGCAVAVYGNTVVIGAPNESSLLDADDNNQRSAGAAYVFVRNGTTWSQQAFLKADSPELEDEFGGAVAISEDSIVIGARLRDGIAEGDADRLRNTGAAYVFVRNETTWSQQAILMADNADESDIFGNAVAISGDIIVIGAEDEDGNATGGGENNDANESGAAYVFVREGTTWSQEAILKANNAGRFDQFGTSVGISGETIVVGAQEEESSATGDGSDNDALDSGAAYVFVRDGSTWSQQAFLKADNADSGDEFGTTVAISGDIIAVGAPREDSGGMNDSGDNSVGNSGAIYIFVRSGTNWNQEAYIKANVVENGDALGQVLAISGETVVAGSDDEDSMPGSGQSNNDLSSSGAVYVFQRDETAWNQVGFLKASNAEGSDRFGASVAVSENFIVVGADDEDSALGDATDNSERNSGAVYVFQVETSDASDIEITNIVVNSSLNIATLTWRSNPGVTYNVDYSLDLMTWEEDLVTGVVHDLNGGGLTSQGISLDGISPEGVQRIFLRVVEE